MERTGRELELVLWGATGFTGGLVAEYLAGRYGGDLRWGLAGRDEAKLEEVRRTLAGKHPEVGRLPLVVADSFDRASLARMAARARVVCSTVGPYAKYGDGLVAACVAEGTDYCDLAGEVPWMRRMIDAHHEAARRTGARIVHACGFDSVPSDLGTLMVQGHARERYGAPCEDVRLYVHRMRGGLSGGTLASMIQTLEEVSRDPEARRAAGHPYALNPEGEREGPDGRPQQGVRWDEALGAWTGPFVMATINERVVRRTNALTGWAYGRGFRYRESSRFGPGLRGRLRATAFAAGVGGFGLGVALKPTRWILQRTVLPAPGEGPARETIEKGYFDLRLLGRGTGADGRPFEVRGKVSAHGDPGYGATARLLGESAVCLARDAGDGDVPGGVLTPASAMGSRLIDRLRGAGVVLEVE